MREGEGEGKDAYSLGALGQALCLGCHLLGPSQSESLVLLAPGGFPVFCLGCLAPGGTKEYLVLPRTGRPKMGGKLSSARGPPERQAWGFLPRTTLEMAPPGDFS